MKGTEGAPPSDVRPRARAPIAGVAVVFGTRLSPDKATWRQSGPSPRLGSGLSPGRGATSQFHPQTRSVCRSGELGDENYLNPMAWVSDRLLTTTPRQGWTIKWSSVSLNCEAWQTSK